MATTQAEATVLASTAGKFDQANTSLQDMLRRLMNELDVLRTQWQGAGGRSFEQVKLAWAQDQDLLHRTLAETADAMRHSAGQYAATDQGAADRLAPARSSRISLPL